MKHEYSAELYNGLRNIGEDHDTAFAIAFENFNIKKEKIAPQKKDQKSIFDLALQEPRLKKLAEGKEMNLLHSIVKFCAKLKYKVHPNNSSAVEQHTVLKIHSAIMENTGRSGYSRLTLIQQVSNNRKHQVDGSPLFAQVVKGQRGYWEAI